MFGNLVVNDEHIFADITFTSWIKKKMKRQNKMKLYKIFCCHRAINRPF